VKVQVHFFSRLKDIAKSSELEVEVKDGASVNDLLGQLYACIPVLRDWDSTILIGAGVEFVGRDHVLQPNEQIAIMPPVQGG
jgi:molybdopterin converting factor small subunit